jgi:CHAT domain-containing protein
VCGPGLPESVTELKRLRAIHPDAVVLDGQDATINAVLSRMDGVRLVRIVAHGTHEPADAPFSRVELGRRCAAGTRAGPAAQPKEHVVLASCELALSRIRPGHEAVGFAGALLATGSRTVVAPVAASATGLRPKP